MRGSSNPPVKPGAEGRGENGTPARVRKLLAAVVDGAGDFRFQIGTVDDAVDKSVLKKKFARLKTFGKLDADGGLDGAWTGKADQRFRFGENQIA